MSAFRMLFSDLRDVAVSVWSLLIFRVAVVILSSLTTAWLLAAVQTFNETIHPFFFNLAAAAAEGIVLGVLARWILPSHSFVLRLAAGMAGVLAGLFYMGLVTWGSIGIFPFPFPRPVPDRLALVLTGSAVLGLFLALLAWNTSLRRKPGLPASSPSVERAPVVIETHAPVVVASGASPVRAAPRWLNRLRRGIQIRHRRDPNLDIRLVGVEDHRCPYCLQPVARRDPRGVVICPDCHTWHHKDCWSVTGMCQIPHEHPV